MKEKHKNSIVKWYIDHLLVLEGERFQNNMNFEMYIFQKEQLEIKAQEMEKEQMIEFGELVWKNLLRSDKIMKPRDVYNATFGGNDEQE